MMVVIPGAMSRVEGWNAGGSPVQARRRLARVTKLLVQFQEVWFSEEREVLSRLGGRLLKSAE